MATFNSTGPGAAPGLLEAPAVSGGPPCTWYAEPTALIYVDPGVAVDNGEPALPESYAIEYVGAEIANADAPSIFPPPGEWSGVSLDDIDVAALLSLHVDRRVEAHEVRPGEDRRGWWGDTFPSTQGEVWGSRLWLAERAKIGERGAKGATTIEQVETWARSALAWLVEDGIVGEVFVEAERLPQGVALRCVLRGEGADRVLLFDPLRGARIG